MKVAAIQHDIVWEDAAATCAHVGPLVATAAGAGARLVVLTEMFATGFSMTPERTAEPPGGPTATFLHQQAERHGVWLTGSIAIADPALPRPVNRLVLAGPDGEHHEYDKLHPFTYSGEHEHYSAGTQFLTVAIDGLRCSFFICYDLRFADEFWGLAHDTDCFVVVANWPEARRRHWQMLVDARAIENQAYVVAVNRVGEGGGLRYAGDTRVVDPFGETLATAAGTETIVLAEVDPARVAEVRARYPFLADRRRSVLSPG